MSYKSTHTGQQIDAGVDAALNPDTTPTEGSNALMTSGGTKSALDTFVRPNLLDNWYFVGGGSQQGGGQLPINQRGQTVYGDTPQYTIDRWKITEDWSGVNLLSDCLRIKGNSVNGYGGIYQLSEQNLVGKTVTASILAKVYTPCKLITKNIDTTAGFELFFYSFVWTSNSRFVVSSVSGAAGAGNPIIDIIAVKLELGPDQTLAHQENGVWVLNDTPKYEDMLRECQKYQIPLPDWTFFSGRVDGDGTAWIFVPTPVTMAKNPTISSGNAIVYLPTGIASVAFGTTGEVLPNGIRFAAQNVGTTNVCCTGGFSTSGLILDANL